MSQNSDRNPKRPPGFQPGQKANPLGISSGFVERSLKALSKEELIEIGTLVIKGTIEDLRALAADPKATVLHTMIASVASRIIQRGDMTALDVLLNRLIGKVRDDIFVSQDQLTAGATINITLPDNGRSARDDTLLVGDTVDPPDTIDIKCS